MKIQGIIKNCQNRDVKSGYSQFTLEVGRDHILCKGQISTVLKFLEVELEGEYREKVFCFDKYNILKEKASLIKVLSANAPNIGSKTADSIVDDYINNGYSHASTLFDNGKKYLDSIFEFDKLYQYIQEVKGNLFIANKLYKKYAAQTIQVIENNPYMLIYYGISFYECDKLGEKLGFPEYDKRRIEGVVSFALEKNINQGNTCIQLDDLFEVIDRIEVKTNRRINRIVLGDILLNDFRVVKDGSDIFVYRESEMKAEDIIVKEINRLASHYLNNEDVDIAKIEEKLNIKYDDTQKDALNITNSSGIKLLLGGPGTGKTTVLNGIITKHCMENKNSKVVLTAPTGQAAKRMSEATGLKAHTIHHTIKLKPYEIEDNLYSSKKIDASLIIVDEFSMVDEALFANLLCAIPNEAIVLLVGDPNQIASVGAGNVLSDLIESNRFETHKLTTIHRQSCESSIIPNAYKVINNDSNLMQDSTFRIHHYKDANSLKQAFLKEVLTDNQNSKAFSPVKNPKYELSTINLNHTIKNELLKNKKVAPIFVCCGLNTFSVGDRVMFIHNNVEKDYYNGDEGVITDIQKHTETIRICVIKDGEKVYLSGSEIDDIELSYCITAHKSQGSEYEKVIIALPKEPANMLQRKLLYVEITRAKKEVLILEENGALQKAIHSFGHATRMTRLKSRLAI